MEQRKIVRVEHVWSQKNYRWIYIERYKDTDFIGLNFMQGDDYGGFVEHWCKVEEGISEFYEYMTCEMDFGTEKPMNDINKVMWMYNTAVRIYEENN
jgi:hypothetical protein